MSVSLPTGSRVNVNNQAPPRPNPPSPPPSSSAAAPETGSSSQQSSASASSSTLNSIQGPVDNNFIDYSSQSSSVFLDFLKRIAWNAKQQPLLLVGLVFTCSSFLVGVHAFKKGNGQRSNLMMRCRVGGQMFTVAAAAWYNWYNKPPRYDEYVLAKRRQQEEQKMNAK